jgi:signal peptidase II
MTERSRSLFWAILIGGVALDRAVKWLEIAGMSIGDSIEAVPGVLNLTYVANRGVGFGLFQGSIWLPIAVSVLVLAIAAVVLARTHPLTTLPAVGWGLLCAGAIGNLMDRLFFGHVVDIFELAFIRYPVFNVADIFVTCGSIALIVWLLLGRDDGRDEAFGAE